LNDTAKNRFIAPFIAKERSLSEAAKIVGVKLNAMNYWVKRLLEMKLIQQTRSESRKGSAVRYYRSVADEIIVPVELIPKESYEVVLQEQMQLTWCTLRLFQRISLGKGVGYLDDYSYNSKGMSAYPLFVFS
jgi:hypothetical protein